MEKNIFLIDWLTFTVKGSTVDQVKALVGMPDHAILWEPLGGCNGYPQSEFYNGVRIMYGASEQMGICCNMSGTGCRTFETFGLADWMKLFDVLVSLGDNINITRCDLAFDDHTGVLDIDRIHQDTLEGNLTMKFRTAKPLLEVDGNGNRLGLNIDYGSHKSKIMIRIYDKAQERGLEDEHWIRVELQLRDVNADSAVKYIHSGMPVGTVFVGVLRNYLQFRDPVEQDSNKSRWPIAEYWAKFLDDAAPLTLWVNPGTEYNLHRLQRFVIDQAGNAVQTAILIYGFDGLLERLDFAKPVSKLPRKYQYLVDLASREGGGFVNDEASS